MIPERRKLVIESWEALSPNGAAVGANFYRRLFEIDPGLQALFSQVTMEDQVRKLVTMLYLGVHWPTDLVGGLLLGVVWLLVTQYAFRPLERRRILSSEREPARGESGRFARTA